MNALGQVAGIRPQPYRLAGFEAFQLGERATYLRDPLEATNLDDAIAETVGRWPGDRGDRIAIRELGEGVDRLHIYAVRRKSAGYQAWSKDHIPSIEHDRWLDHICTVDLNTVAGLAPFAVGCEIDLHDRRQAKRPGGARLRREAAQ